MNNCESLRVIPGEEADARIPEPTGVTFSRYANDQVVAAADVREPYVKPPYSRITAIDMNTGEHLFQIPTGETPDRIRNNPALALISAIPAQVMSSRWSLPKICGLLDVDHDGETALLYAISKQSGYELGRIGVLVRSRYGMSSWVHDGYQYLMLQTGAKLTAVALPAAAPGSFAH